jgi:hypothetical protein
MRLDGMSTAQARTARVNVTIDRLVLRGMDPAARTAFVDGLRGELARVLADPAARAEMKVSRRTPVLRMGQMPLGNGPSGARGLGRSVAQAIGRNGNAVVSKGARR